MIHALELEEIAISRGARRLFSSFSLGVTAGEAVMLAGANGAGKTSLIRVVAGLLRPDGGQVRFCDAAAGMIEPDLARARHIHLSGHYDGLKTQRTAGDEFAFWADWLGGAVDDRAVAIETYELKPLMGLDVRVLSAGQRRRLALARLRAAPRALWLLDEPLAPLDSRWRAAFGAQMAAHLASGGMILAAAHDPLPVAHRTAEVGA